MRGYSRLNRKIVRGRSSETAAKPNPIRRIPARPLLASFAVVSACSESFSNLSANGNKTLPVSVNVTLRRVRAKSPPPTFSSSRRICLLSAGCDMQRRSAALRKCNSRARIIKDFNSYGSRYMPTVYHWLHNDSLDETTWVHEDTE